jgi:multiple sugar transport system substrate-binding protein
MNSRRRDVLKGASVGLVAGFAGCLGGGNGDGSDGGGTTGNGGDSGTETIVYLSDRSGMEDIITEIHDAFEEEHPEYTVENVFVPKGGVTEEEQIQQMKAAGNPPDVQFHAGTSIYSYALNGNLAPVTSTIEDTGIKDMMRMDGESYYVPTSLEPLAGWYRNDIFDEQPSSWDTALSESRRIGDEVEGMKGWAILSGNLTNPDSQLNQYLWGNEVEIFSGPQGSVEVVMDQGENRERAIEVFEWMKEIEQYGPNANGWSWGAGADAVQQGNLASHMGLGALTPLIVSANNMEIAETLELTPWPTPSDVTPSKLAAYTEGHCVRSDGNNTEGGKLFVDFFAKSDMVNEFLLGSPGFQMPMRKDNVSDYFGQDHDFLNSQWGQQMEQYLLDNWDRFQTRLDTADNGEPNELGARSVSVATFGQTVEQLIVNDLSPEETVDWMAKELRALKDE